MKILIFLVKRASYILLLSFILSTNQQITGAKLPSFGITENSFVSTNTLSPKLIMFISEDVDFDSTALRMLRAEGYTVVTTYPSPLSTQEMIDSLNKADLIIVGRSSTSSDLALAKLAWNSLKVPLMLMSQHSSARDKLGWFNSIDVPHVTTVGKIYGYRTQKDTIFYGVNFLSGDTMEWSEKPEDIVIVDATTNGNVLVRIDSTINALLVVRFEPGTPFYAGSCDKPYAPRTFFATGLNTGGTVHTFPLSAEAKKVWLAEVKRMSTTPYTLYTPLTDAGLSNLIIDKGTLIPIFDPGINSYSAQLPFGTTTVKVTPTTNSCATYTGAGNINVSSGSVVTNVIVKAEDGVTTKTFTINFTVATSINGIESGNIKMYPNPAKSLLDIQLDKTYIGGEICIFDLLGEKIIEKTITCEIMHMDIAGLKPGMYIVKANNKKTTAFHKLEIR